MCLGLLVSALVSTSEKAMPFLVLLTMIQVILSGGVISLAGKAGLSQLAWISPSRWGYGALAATANLDGITPNISGNITDPLWTHSAATWLQDMGAQAALALIFVLLAWARLRRLGPRRRRS
jgi:ABC transport system ATP-binding/permease protein